MYGAGAVVTYQVYDQYGEVMSVSGMIPTETVNGNTLGQTVPGFPNAGSCVMANCAGTDSSGQYVDGPVGSLSTFPSFDAQPLRQVQNIIYNGQAYNVGTVVWNQQTSFGQSQIQGSNGVVVSYPPRNP